MLFESFAPFGGSGIEPYGLGHAKQALLATSLARGGKKTPALLELFWKVRDGTQEGTRCLLAPERRAVDTKAG